MPFRRLPIIGPIAEMLGLTHKPRFRSSKDQERAEGNHR